jgi:large subunit ribosomal protein L13
MEHTIDAKNKSIGRVAAQAASLLTGKNTTTYTRNAAPAGVSVKIVNAQHARIPVKKRLQKTYRAYSGYPHGLKTPTLEQIVSAKGHAELFRKAVYGMLPRNRMRAGIMKRLTISE